MRRNCSKTRGPRHGRRGEGGSPSVARGRRAEEGFTLVEVVLALMILAIATVILLDRRVGIIRETIESKHARMVWVLAANKMAELELEPTLFAGEGSSGNGDFSEVGPEYVEFQWEYEIVKIEIPMDDPMMPMEAPQAEEQPKYLYQLTLNVYAPGREVPYVIQGAFPPYELIEAARGGAAATAGTEGAPQRPESATSTPRGNR